MRFRFEGCLLDCGTRELFRGERRVHLSPKAFRLLEVLVAARPNAVSKDDIHRRLWGDVAVVDGNLANLVNEARDAVGDDARRQRVIRTVPRFGYAFTSNAEPEEAAVVGAESDTVYRLIWGDREIALVAGENVIGRDRDTVVWLDDVSVSRRHARIVIDGDGARVEDLGSKNGTYVEGKRVSRSIALRDGNALRLGSVALVFRRFDAGLSTETASRR